MKRITELLSDIPIMINIVEGGRTPVLNVKELESLGFRIAIFPCSACSAAVKAIQGVLRELKEKGSTDDFAENMLPLKEMFELVGLSRYRELERKYVNF
jgi:methylisocitrate lyase